jgi:sulfonate dioxygenase
MAPALVETQQAGSTFDAAFRQVSGVGQYKEAYIGGPKAFKKEVEEKGSETQPPASHANYLPVWDREKRILIPPWKPHEPS